MVDVDVGIIVGITALPQGVGIGLPRIDCTVALLDTTLEFGYGELMSENFSFSGNGTFLRFFQS